MTNEIFVLSLMLVGFCFTIWAIARGFNVALSAMHRSLQEARNQRDALRDELSSCKRRLWAAKFPKVIDRPGTYSVAESLLTAEVDRIENGIAYGSWRGAPIEWNAETGLVIRPSHYNLFRLVGPRLASPGNAVQKPLGPGILR